MRTRTLVTLTTAIMTLSSLPSTMTLAQRSAASDPVTGVVRALMTNRASSAEGALEQVVLDTGREMIPLADNILDDLHPGSVAVHDARRGTTKPAPAAVSKATLRSDSRYAPLAARNLAVVPLTWEGSPFSDSRMATLTSTLAELDQWWSTASSGIEDLTIRTLPIVTIPVVTDCEKEISSLSHHAINAVSAQALTEWATNISIILPDTNPCWWGGLGQMPGKVTWMKSLSLKVFVHELGHNMGLPHANSCNAAFTVSLVGTCEDAEYGDTVDPMGSAWTTRLAFGPAYLERIGWLPESHATTWNGTDSTYTLTSVDITSGGLRGVRIDARGPLDKESPGDYWLQFRAGEKPSSRALGTKPGVYLTLSSTRESYRRRTTNPSRWGTPTWLCDLTPTGQRDYDSAFGINIPWTDPSGLFTVTVTTINSDSATIRVAPAVGVAPSAPTILTAAALTGEDQRMNGQVQVNWNTTTPTLGQAEPVAVSVLLEGTTLSCTAPTHAGSCVISSVPRNTPLTVSASSRNYSGSSSPVATTIDAIPTYAPSASLAVDVFPGARAEIEVQNLNDGGSPLTHVGPITVTPQKKCADTSKPCKVSGLLPRKTYTATLELRNAVGSTTVSTTFTTDYAPPRSPNVTYSKKGRNLLVKIRLNSRDTTNVDNVALLCWSRTDRMGRVISRKANKGRPISFRLSPTLQRRTCVVDVSTPVGSRSIVVAPRRQGISR